MNFSDTERHEDGESPYVIPYRNTQFNIVLAHELERAICDVFQIPHYSVRSFFQSFTTCNDECSYQVFNVKSVPFDHLDVEYGEKIDRFVMCLRRGDTAACYNPLTLYQILNLLASFGLIPSGRYIVEIQ